MSGIVAHKPNSAQGVARRDILRRLGKRELTTSEIGEMISIHMQRGCLLQALYAMERAGKLVKRVGRPRDRNGISQHEVAYWRLASKGGNS